MNPNVLACEHEPTAVMTGIDEQGDKLCVHVCEKCSNLSCFSDFKMEVIAR